MLPSQSLAHHSSCRLIETTQHSYFANRSLCVLRHIKNETEENNLCENYVTLTDVAAGVVCCYTVCVFHQWDTF